MKRILALLLTLAMLLTMVGTAAVAAEEATAKIPEFTATVAKDGTVTVKVDDGVKDYQTKEAYLIKKDKNDVVTWSGWVQLEYDSSKKAYIGKDENAAGADFDRVRLWKDTVKENTKGTEKTETNVEFLASYYDGELSQVEYNTSVLTQEKNKKDEWFVSEANYEELRNDYNTKTGKLSEEYQESGKTTGDETEQNSKSSSETKRYEEYQGIYTGKTVTESESKSVYSKTQGRWYEESKKETSKTYNEDGVLTGTGEGNSKTTYNTKGDEEAYEYSNTEKSFSSKGYLNNTYNTTETSNWKLEDDSWNQTDYHYERKTTNRNGDVSYTYETTREDGKDSAYTQKTTEKNYNTYTGAVKNSYVTETERYKNKKEDKWELEQTQTSTYNNDDGSQRRKTVTTSIDWQTIEKTHYDSADKVAAKYTYDTKKEVGTWVDGNGKVIGKNEVDEETGDSSSIWGVSFKTRTGELDSWTTEEKTTDKEGTTTSTTTYYDEGKKDYTNETITEKDGSYKSYEKGVLRESYDSEDQETKYYDIKGALKSSEKYDKDDDLWKTYNYDGKLTSTRGYNDGKQVWTYYDPSTGKVERSETYFYDSEAKAWVGEYRDAKDQVTYSEKSFYDEDLETSVTAYYDAKDKEFARTYSKKEDGVNTTQGIYKAPATDYYKDWDPEEASGQIEKAVSETENDYRKTTATTDYTKWTVSNGKETDKMTRKDQTITTWDNDKREVSKYVGGTLAKNTLTEKNDYDDYAKTTVKWYNWYDAKPTATDKTIKSDIPNDPITYSKYYDAAGNLQYYSEVDNTDSWNWNHTYFASGNLSQESWYDGLDGDSSYTANYTYYGTLSNETTWEGNGDERNGRYVAYNDDGSYRYWSDTVNGVDYDWVYNKKGQLEKYRWNEQTDDNGVHSYEIWDAAGTLLYTCTDYAYEGNWVPLADGTYITKTDAAGNKWARKVADGENEVELTLKNKANGWQYAVGEWFYIEKGEPVTESWKQIDGSWYYFNADGAMSKGIVAIADKNDEGTYTTYAANDNGTVTSGWTGWKDYYGDQHWTYTNANGEVLTGWQNLGGQWYYFSDGWYQTTDDTYYKDDVEWAQSGNRGYMATGATKIWNSDWASQHTYFFNEDGTWDNSPGWKVANVEVGTRDHRVDGDDYIESIWGIEYHYYNQNGVEVTGWNNIDGDWYYFDENGVMKNGWVKSGPNWYFLDPSAGGAMATDGWTEDVYEGWYYMDKNGNYKTGWLQDGNTWYYLKDDGSMAENEWAKSGSDWYYMDESGAMATGWIQDHGNWYCLKSDGTMKTGWEGSGNTWYYLNEDGTMAADTDVTIDGKTYHFDETGLCTNP